ncbi:MAG: TetR family transcriptional regulator C-terminal domain-containing protein [Granulosicoccaceae bacterium]
MNQRRKPYVRASEEQRHQALILATQRCVALGGVQRATVRNIAAEAGVTPGLIRHYFPGKAELLCATYQFTMTEMTAVSVQATQRKDCSAIERLHHFVRATLSAPVMSAERHQLWASFTSLIRTMPELAKVHRESYLEFRQACSTLVAEVLAERGLKASPLRVEQLAIAINAVLDGLWLEGCLATELFGEQEIAEIGVRSVDDLLGLST